MGIKIRIINMKENISLKYYNSFRIDEYAKYFATFNSIKQLEENLNFKTDLPLFILGGGSNILLTKPFDGVVLKNEIEFIEVSNETDEYIFVKAGAGQNWHQLVMFCVENNYGGIENLSLIPGNVGASPMQNIGAYGVEIKDVFYELTAYDLIEKTIKKFTSSDCEFGYRESIFKSKLKGRFVILDVTIKLSKKHAFNISYGAIKQELDKMNCTSLNLRSISQAIISIRRSKLPDPNKIGNAGSFFKNPVISAKMFNELKMTIDVMPYYQLTENTYKLPAGWLIEQCGWKGFRKGDAGCHNKQALVLVNYGSATGNEIFMLAENISNSVKDKFNINLEKEVNII